MLSWAWDNRLENPHQLALTAKGQGRGVALMQITALQKVRHKIPDWYRPDLEFPLPVSVEQASSQATALFKAGLFSGQRAADLTGGLGADTFFMGRSFSEMWYIEQNPVLFEAVQRNFTTLEQSHIRCVKTDAASFLQGTTLHFDLLYIDPARRDDRRGRVFQLQDCLPDILALKSLLFERTSSVLLKAAPMLDIKAALRQLENVARVWVVESEGECRELLFHLQPQPRLAENETPVVPVVLRPDGQVQHQFDLTFQEEVTSLPLYSVPLRYLYDPPAAILKAGAFRTFGLRYGLQKLHPHTHLYTSEHLVPGVPGRCFTIQEVVSFDKKALRMAIPDGKAHLAVRNFPETTEQLRKKSGLADGGTYYVFCVTYGAGKRGAIVTKALSA